MAIRTTVWITTSFEGVHRWKDAPEDQYYLREWHRHMFHVKVGKTVTSDDREVEFHQLKADVDTFVWQRIVNEGRFEYSCEQMAKIILDKFNASFVEVSEDGENGARIETTGVDSLITVRKITQAEEDAQLPILDLTEEADSVVKEVEKRTLTVDRTKCFFGIEAEGPHRGAPTLFVPGSVSPKDFKKARKVVYKNLDGTDYTEDELRVYYGAGNDRAIREDTFRKILSRFSPEMVTVECKEVPDWLAFNGGHTIVCLEEDITAQYLKKELAETIEWRPLESETDEGTYSTHKDDPLFAQDVTLDY